MRLKFNYSVLLHVYLDDRQVQMQSLLIDCFFCVSWFEVYYVQVCSFFCADESALMVVLSTVDGLWAF